MVTRSEAIGVLDNVVVAPVTSTNRTIPTCLPLGSEEGIDHDSVASFDNLSVVPKSLLHDSARRAGIGGISGNVRRTERCGRLLTSRDSAPALDRGWRWPDGLRPAEV